MSKVGTKHAAMACDPVHSSTHFGETDILQEQCVALAATYVVRACAGARSTTTADTNLG